jgi:MFS family permease
MTQPVDAAPVLLADVPVRASRTAAGMFGPLRTDGYLRLWLGSTLVLVGVMGQSIARSWLAFDLTGSNAALGGVLLAFGLAMAIATPFGGVVGDRLPKRATLQFAILLLAVTSGWIGVAMLCDVLAYWMLVVVSASQAIAFALYNPARMAFISELVPDDEVPEAVALMLVNAEASRVVGPALAGLVIATASYGIEAVFLCGAALYLVGMLAGIGLPPGRSRRSANTRSPLGDVRDGVRYVRQRGELSILLLCTFAVVMLGLPYLAFLPTLSEGIFEAGPVGYGLLSASSAVGAVLAGLVTGRLRRRVDPWKLVAASGMVFGAGVASLAIAPSFLVAVLLLVPVGAGLLVFQTLTQSLLMTLSDVEFHGRIQGLVMLSFAGFGIVALPLGLLADAISLRVTFAAMGGCVLLCVAGFAAVSRRYWGQGVRAQEGADSAA